MAFKFSLQTEPSVESVDTLLDDMAELSEIKGEIESLIGQLPELDAVYENLTSSIEALNNAKDKDEAVRALNVDGSLEALLGVAEDKITAKAAMEGFGDKLKEWWNKFVEWVKRLCRRISNFFRKLFGMAPKVSKEAQELADLTGEDPEKVQQGLDKMKDELEKAGKQLAAAFDNAEFEKAFNEGMKLGQEAFKQLDTASKIQSANREELDRLTKETEKVMAELADPNSALSKSIEEAGKAMWGDDFSYIRDSNEGIAVAVTVAAVQANLKAVSKDSSAKVPNMSKQLADSTDKCEKVISQSALARMSAKEIDEFYASGGKVEDPALFKAAVATYKGLSKAVTVLHAKLGKLLSARMSREQKYVNTCKKAIASAA